MEGVFDRDTDEAKGFAQRPGSLSSWEGLSIEPPEHIELSGGREPQQRDEPMLR